MSGYVLFPAAQTDLESIWDYTSAHWGVAQAERYTRNIQAVCEALSKGELVSRSADDIREGYRKVTVGSHVVFFRVRSDVVEIIRILHRSMDVGRHL